MLFFLMKANNAVWVQIGQLFKIFQTLGTPDEASWPGVSALPDWQPVFPAWRRRPLHEVTPPVLSYVLSPLVCWQGDTVRRGSPDEEQFPLHLSMES